jgi:hypothetical protein
MGVRVRRWGCGGGRSGEVTQTIYIHVSKCKTDKIKEKKKGRVGGCIQV